MTKYNQRTVWTVQIVKTIEIRKERLSETFPQRTGVLVSLKDEPNLVGLGRIRDDIGR